MDKRIQELGEIVRNIQSNVEGASKLSQTLKERSTERSGLNLERILEKINRTQRNLENVLSNLSEIKEDLRKANKKLEEGA